ncbi:MAG: pentapeptide repeat-containing protein [Rhodospirillales bacterium]|nr:pentapeptide repeat-containing protein [Rhodospirillales bacterium]
MSDEPYKDHNPAIPYLELIKLGVCGWNHWIRGDLTAEESAEIAEELGLKKLPKPPSGSFIDRANPVNFFGVDFTKGENSRITFAGALFGDGAIFQSATFGDEANFQSATFGDEANFQSATFGGNADFQFATFGVRANFSDATFKGYAYFSGRISKEIHETQNALEIKRNLTGANRRDLVKEKLNDFDLDNLANISFHKAHFLGGVEFKDRKFEGFSQARFDQPPVFENCEGMERLDVMGANFGFAGLRPKYLWWDAEENQSGWTTDSNIPTRLRILRKQMEDIKAHDAERDLFIAERMAERGVLWDAAFKKLFPLKSFITMQWPVSLLKAIGATGLLFFFQLLSDCGRSAKRPFVLFAANMAGFYYLYSALIPPTLIRFEENVRSFTLGHSLPFATSLSPVQVEVMKRLFGDKLEMPFCIELLSIFQSLIGALLLFLFLQAVRNHFRLR